MSLRVSRQHVESSWLVTIFVSFQAVLVRSVPMPPAFASHKSALGKTQNRSCSIMKTNKDSLVPVESLPLPHVLGSPHLEVIS